MRKKTCNGEYTKHCTRSRHQLKMAAPAEVSKKHSNFRIRQSKETRHFNIATNLTLNTMVSFVILLIARTARIACVDRHTDRQTDRQTHTHTHETTTVTLAAHTRRRLISCTIYSTLYYLQYIVLFTIHSTGWLLVITCEGCAYGGLSSIVHEHFG